MKLHFKRKAENDFLNPNFKREKTLTLSFNGGRVFAPAEYDLLAMAGKAIPYLFAIEAAHQFSSGNTVHGLGLSLIPLLSILTRSSVIRNDNEDVAPRFQDMRPDEIKKRAKIELDFSQENHKIDAYQNSRTQEMQQRNTLRMPNPI